MKIVGLTGSIGMGKSVATGLLRRLGVAVHCADEAAHKALGANGAGVDAVGKLYPQALKQDPRGNYFIDRKILGNAAFADVEFMKKLEAILHPLTHQSEKRFLRSMRAQRKKLVIFDIPLLFEGGRDKDLSAVWVVSATPFIQRQRVLARPGMNEPRLAAVLARQMPDAKKRQRADMIVPTGLGRAATLRKLKAALKRVQ